MIVDEARSLNITIKNCNSINSADINIVKGSLNIKYGPNGLGKSTIAKAIVGQVRDDGTLDTLIPFKNQGQASAENPQVHGVNGLSSALVFDEDYVNQFVFQQDEVIKDSFDIFIKTSEYAATEQEIENLLVDIKSFANKDEIKQTIKDLKELGDAFGKPNKTGEIPKSSKMYKAFGSGNKIDNVPETLKPFAIFIKSQEPSKWIAWQIKGNEFLKLGDTCPYCSTKISEDTKETAHAVDKEYNSNNINHLNTLKAIIERLGKYFSDECREDLEKVTKAKIDLTKQQQEFLSDLKSDIDHLIEKLEGLEKISFFSLKNVENLNKELEQLKIELGSIKKLDSEETRKVVEPINRQLEALTNKVENLKGSINKHKARIEKTIKENEKSINNFLKWAGYKYSVEMIPEQNSYKMTLIHRDLSKHIESASKHLSYGEKNAFALVLFMYQVLSENPDIVVLDDPISSFDKNKKFAILYELFRGKASLKGHTTLMLTHDIEPAIDVIKSKSGVFQGSRPSATFLTSRDGQVKEVPIERNDIQTFAKICKENVTNLTDPIVKAIYLRRHYEILDDMGLEYNLLASLFKKRDTPTIKTTTEDRNMTDEEKSQSEEKIKEHISDFDYDELVNQVKDIETMKEKFFATEVGYEKIQLFRIIKGYHADDVITKFINESYHIENEYVMQLNPHKFNSIPEYVINECTQILQSQ